MMLDHALFVDAREPAPGAILDTRAIRTVSGGGSIPARRLWPVHRSQLCRAVGNELRKLRCVQVATCRCPRDIGEDEAKAFFAGFIVAALQFYRTDRDGQCGLRVNFFCDREQAVSEGDGSGGRQDEAYLISFVVRPGGYLSLVVLHYGYAFGHAGYRHGFILSVVSPKATVAEGVAFAITNRATPEADADRGMGA